MMKKFSKLIKESKKENWTKHPLVNPVDWDDIFNPLIEHIDSNLISKTPPPGEGLFSSKTKAALDQLIDSITEDYSDYFKDVIHDGSQESFFDAFDIDVNYDDILECLQTLSDRTDDIEDNPEWDWGCYMIDFTKIKYKDLEELIEDIEEVHLRLKMLNVDYAIRIGIISSSITILKSSKDIGKIIKENWKDSWGKQSNDISLFTNAKNSGIRIFIFNKSTIQVGDFN